MNLENKIAIVTGGAMGNGLGIVNVLIKYKAKVIVLDYSDEIYNLENVDIYKVDIRNKEEINNIIEDIIKKYNKIDILINNAGVAKIAPFLETDDKLRDFHFDINIKGSWNLCQAVIPYMVKENYGKIVNLSSVTGFMVADPLEVAYATTKAAIIGFTKSLAREFASNNITVNAVCPGYILTPMVEGIASYSDSSNPNQVIEGIRKAIPLNRLGNILELGELVAFLASDNSSYITGTEIVIDGGSTLPETSSVGI